MEKIQTDEVLDHIANSVEGYEDEYGYYWAVSVRGGVLVVTVDHDDQDTQEFYLTATRVESPEEWQARMNQNLENLGLLKPGV